MEPDPKLSWPTGLLPRIGQYNRITIPAAELGGDSASRCEYRELGWTEGFGCTHFSRQTSDEVEKLIEASQQKRRVKSIFGEGVSQRLRKLRVGFRYVGLPSL